MTTVKVKVSAKESKEFDGLSEVNPSHYNIGLVLHNVFRVKRQELIAAYALASGMSEQDIEFNYEGGISDWIGFGSVTCFEISCRTHVSMVDDIIEVMLVSL